MEGSLEGRPSVGLREPTLSWGGGQDPIPGKPPFCLLRLHVQSLRFGPLLRRDASLIAGTAPSLALPHYPAWLAGPAPRVTGSSLPLKAAQL